MSTKYVDLEILAEVADDDYLIRISKADLNTLVTFHCSARISDELVLRHWDGEHPVELEEYGENAVRTREDSTSSNNLSQLPRIGEHRLSALLANL